MGKFPQEKDIGVSIPLELNSRIKHPECVESIVAELSNGIKVELLGFIVPENTVAYIVEYKRGPCRAKCNSLYPEIQTKGCYNGRVDRIEVSEL